MEGHLSVSLLLNIGLLLLSATFLTACKPLQGILRPQSPSSPLQQLILAVLFGGMAILSTYFGMEVQGAIVNTRVISVTAAGLIGGPVAGIGAGLIGGLHRYFYSPGSFTTLGCCVGTVCFGVVGSVAHAHQGRFSTSRPRLVLLTVTGELLQVGWLFLLARPISAVVALEKVIFLPKILLNSLGMVFFFEIFHRLDQTRVDEQIQYQSEALYIAQQCLPHLRQGLRPGEDLCRTADIIRRNSAGYQVIFTDRRQVLSSSGITLDSAVLPEPSRACLASSQTQICRCKAPLSGAGDSVTVALHCSGNIVGTLMLVVDQGGPRIAKADVSFAENLGQFFSTILDLNSLDYQIELRRQAEFRAFQSQINPHFFCNALNTISALCRTAPDEARRLLLVLAEYYRQILSINEDFVPLEQELRNMENYLTIARARFVGAIHVTMDLPDSAEGCLLPPLIIQPLVENAVRHGGTAVNDRRVSLTIRREAGMLSVQVTDQGHGFPPQILAELADPDNSRYSGLFNVNKRLISIYGPSGALQVNSTPQGSSVAFRIPLHQTVKGGPGHEDRRDR